METKMINFKPIETAPKDRTIIGAIERNLSGTKVLYVMGDIDWRGDAFFDVRSWEVAPTHWMPKTLEYEQACGKAMEWTKEKPSKPGHYWTRGPMWKEEYTHKQRIVKVRERFLGDYSELSIENCPLPNNNEWAGPITEPTEPKESNEIS